MEIRPYTPTDASMVVHLWRQCDILQPQNDPLKDIRRKLAVQAELFLVAVKQGRVVATVMAGYDGHRGWLNYLAVSPDHRRNGVGRRMVREVEIRLRALGCPKINLQVRTSNTDAIGFYQAIGFVEDQVRSMGKRLVSD